MLALFSDLDNIVIDDTQFLILRDYSLAIQDLQNNMLEVDGMTFDPNFLNEALDDDVLSETSDTSDVCKILTCNHFEHDSMHICCLLQHPVCQFLKSKN